MKRTTTRVTEVWSPCSCGGHPYCPICKGGGTYLSAITKETLIEDITGSPEEVVDAEEVIPLLGKEVPDAV